MHCQVAWITRLKTLWPGHSATTSLMSEIGTPKDDSTHALFTCTASPEMIGGTKARLDNQREFGGRRTSKTQETSVATKRKIQRRFRDLVILSVLYVLYTT